MLQVGSEPEQPRPVLDGGGPQGIEGLFRMAALDSAIADRAAGYRDPDSMIRSTCSGFGGDR